MSVFGDLRESNKGSITARTQAMDELYEVSSPVILRNSLAQPVKVEPAFKTDILEPAAPKSMDYRNRKSTFYVDQYARASYYFNHCSIFATTVLRTTQEALRNGIEWKAKFQCKCPRCSTQFPRTTRKCKNCGFEGTMLEPDETQKDLLVNWEGTSLFDKANRNGWDLLQLVRSFLIVSLVYNQPVILCKSAYFTDAHGNVIEEFPQEFMPISPAKAKMIYDESGSPGDNTGFSVLDRAQSVLLTDPDVEKEIFTTGYYKDRRYYPCRWCITETDGGTEGSGEYFADQEIYHDTYILPSITYGTPLCLLVEADIRAWMALELRIEKYFSTGHPLGAFVVNNITPESTAKLQQSIRIQMREDPYTIPVLGIPPASDKATSTKWHPFATDPTEAMIAVKQELLQRITAIFGMSGLFLGDTDAMRGNGNEGHQVAILDRNLGVIRTYANKFLAWIIKKYKGITDWDIVVVQPPDNQSLDEAEKFNKQLLNAKLAKDLGFEIISQNDGIVEISATPQSYDPLQAMFGDGGGLQAEGFGNDNQQKQMTENVTSNSIFKDSLSKSSGGSDMLKRGSFGANLVKGQSLEEMVADAILTGRIKVNDLYIRR